MILTCPQRVDEARLRTKSWQDHGCQRKVKLLADREELARGWMMSKMHFRLEEEMAEACCAMRMMEAEAGAQERLNIEIQHRWHPHHD